MWTYFPYSCPPPKMAKCFHRIMTKKQGSLAVKLKEARVGRVYMLTEYSVMCLMRKKTPKMFFRKIR